MGHIAAERMTQSLCVVREYLCIVRPARDGNIGEAVVEQVFRPECGVHVNEDTVGCLALAGMAGHGIAVIKMRWTVRTNFDRASAVHLEPQVSVVADVCDRPQFTVRHFEMVYGRSELNVVAD